MKEIGTFSSWCKINFKLCNSSHSCCCCCCRVSTSKLCATYCQSGGGGGGGGRGNSPHSTTTEFQLPKSLSLSSFYFSLFRLPFSSLVLLLLLLAQQNSFRHRSYPIVYFKRRVSPLYIHPLF